MNVANLPTSNVLRKVKKRLDHFLLNVKASYIKKSSISPYISTKTHWFTT